MTGVPFVIEGVAIAAWLRLWPRVRRAGRGARFALVVGCWALTLANLIAFTMSIR